MTMIRRNDQRVLVAYEKAKATGGYDHVLHINGADRKHYDLKQHDPDRFAMIEAAWNYSVK